MDSLFSFSSRSPSLPGRKPARLIYWRRNPFSSKDNRPRLPTPYQGSNRLMDSGVIIATGFLTAFNRRSCSTKSFVIFTIAPSSCLSCRQGRLAESADFLYRFSKRSSAQPLDQEAGHLPPQVFKALFIPLCCR